MNILTPLKDLIDRLRQPKRKTGRPYDLSSEELNALRRLTTKPEWKVYQDLLDTVCKLKVEGALVSKEANPWDRGYLSGLRKAGILPHEIVHRVERERERRDQRDAERAERDAERRRTALFGTGFWSEAGGGNGRG